MTAMPAIEPTTAGMAFMLTLSSALSSVDKENGREKNKAQLTPAYFKEHTCRAYTIHCEKLSTT